MAGVNTQPQRAMPECQAPASSAKRTACARPVAAFMMMSTSAASAMAQASSADSATGAGSERAGEPGAPCTSTFGGPRLRNLCCSSATCLRSSATSSASPLTCCETESNCASKAPAPGGVGPCTAGAAGARGTGAPLPPGVLGAPRSESWSWPRSAAKSSDEALQDSSGPSDEEAAAAHDVDAASGAARTYPSTASEPHLPSS